MIVPQQGEQGA